MKLLTNEQICENLLKWEPVKKVIDKSYVGAPDVMFRAGWNTPEGKFISGTPPFLTDLQACFDCIVPMLNEKDLNVEIISVNDEKRSGLIIDSMTGMLLASGTNEKPAPAFIEALSKWWGDQND